MEITEFVFKLFVLFFPGIITYLIVQNLSYFVEKKNLNLALYSGIFGLGAYLTYWVILRAINYFSVIETDVSFISNLLNTSTQLDISEIINVTFIAVFNGFILAVAIRENLLAKIGFGFSKKSIQPSRAIWNSILFERIGEWVVIRDMENDLMYRGWLRNVSDTADEGEIFLRDVRVSKNASAKKLYETPGIYLKFDVTKISIEFIDMQFSEVYLRLKGEKNEKD